MIMFYRTASVSFVRKQMKPSHYKIRECCKVPQWECKTRHNLVKKDDPLGIVQEIEIQPYNQIVYV